MLIGNRVITHIREHDNSILIISNIRFKPVDLFHGFVEACADGGASRFEALVYFGPHLFFTHFGNILAFDHGPRLSVEDDQ